MMNLKKAFILTFSNHHLFPMTIFQWAILFLIPPKGGISYNIKNTTPSIRVQCLYRFINIVHIAYLVAFPSIDLSPMLWTSVDTAWSNGARYFQKVRYSRNSGLIRGLRPRL